MKKTLLIDKTNDCTALAENGVLIELFIDSQNTAQTGSEKPAESGSWVGRVIVGRLKTILPGQFAFVDIGAKKNAFINLRKGHGLRAGMPVLVQVEKDASGTKGICVRLEVSLKGRLAVLYAPPKEGPRPHPGVGISRKIGDEKEARRLKKIVRKHIPPGFSVIVRTNAQNQPEEAIASEINSLHKAFEEILARAEYALPPATLWPATRDEVISQSLLSDILSEELDEIHIQTDFDEEYAALQGAITELLPALAPKISRQAISLKKQIRAALAKEVPLPCGGYITIEQTEACVVIDVNTGSNVGNESYRQTVLETNLEAAAAIAAQLRLRNLSGIIIADFIDMQHAADKDELLAALAAGIKKDRIKTEIIGFIGLGMLQLTRQRTRPPLAEFYKCPHCGGVSSN